MNTTHGFYNPGPRKAKLLILICPPLDLALSRICLP